MNPHLWYKDRYGNIKIEVALLIFIGGALVLITPLVYFSWLNYENVLLSMSCEELSYTMKNRESDSQMVWHFNDRCLQK